MANKIELLKRRKYRVRAKLHRISTGRPRLSVFRSNQHIYAQLIDDAQGITLAAASTLEGDVRSKVKNGGNKEAATVVGRLIAERALKKGVTEVVFDRGGYIYHGRVQSLAAAARDAGLKF